MLSQVDEGARKQFWLQFEHTKYTDENKQAMALLFILIERKDQITKRLATLQQKFVQYHKQEEDERNQR